MTTDFFIELTEDCYKDSSGVYKDGRKVSLSNSVACAYAYYNDFVEMNAVNPGIGHYNSEASFVLVGAIPNCTESQAQIEIMECMDCDEEIQNIEFRKDVIAEEEGIDVSRFDGVVLFRAEFKREDVELYTSRVPFS